MPSRSSRYHRRVVLLTLLAVLVLAGVSRADDAPPYRVRHRFPASNEESCGIDTLYLCAKIQAYEGSLQRLEEMLPLDKRGVSLASLDEAARSNGVQGELLHTDLARLQRWRLPAILHVNDSHFIGFVGTTEEGLLLLFDNAVGLLDCTPEWFDERYRWGGDALVMGAVPRAWHESLFSPWVLIPGSVTLLLLVPALWRKPSPRPLVAPSLHEGDSLP